MILIFEIISALCLIYAVILAVYSGLSTSFLLFWPVMTVVFASMSLWIRYTQSSPVTVQTKIRVITIIAAAVAVFLAAEAVVFWGVLSSNGKIHPRESRPEYCIVLGARLNKGEPSRSLELRLQRAYEYLQENPGVILVLSGGKGPNESVSEAEAMREWMVRHHVPEYCYLMEDRSVNTVQNIAFSLDVIRRHVEERMLVPVRVTVQTGGNRAPIEEQEMNPVQTGKEYRIPPIGVLTSDFHIYRAQRVFERATGQSCAGIAAKTDPVMFLHLWVREGVAVLKDKFVGNI